MLVKDILDYLCKRFPLVDAEDFDAPKLGLVIGDEKIEVKSVMLSLDLTEEVLKEAIIKNCNLIITHHPYLFNPLTKILFDTPQGRVISALCENKISVISMHTNMDVGSGGVNDYLAEKLALRNVKIVDNLATKGHYLRFGDVEKQTVHQFANYVKQQFALSGVKVTLANKEITRVGIVGGSGAHPQDIICAIENGCDCYVTGEIKLPAAQFAYENNLALIEVNHGVEKFVFEKLAVDLSTFLKLANVYITTINTDPFETI